MSGQAQYETGARARPPRRAPRRRAPAQRAPPHSLRRILWQRPGRGRRAGRRHARCAGVGPLVAARRGAHAGSSIGAARSVQVDATPRQQGAPAGGGAAAAKPTGFTLASVRTNLLGPQGILRLVEWVSGRDALARPQPSP
jgi:hypothetical protein